jgi:HAD superfamily hydrolase (TIGR01509 family)
MLKAAIFDMDGLLIDSEPYWRRSHIEVLGKYGFMLTEDDVRSGAGKRTPDQVAVWQERFKWQDLSNEAVTRQIVDNVISLVHLNGQALPGVYEVIELLNKHDIPIAVASSSTPELIKVVLDRLNLGEHVKVWHSAEDEEHGKPHPDVFLTTAKSLSVEPGNCLVFEDSLNGVKAAKAAGMKCIAVPEHPHDPPKFKIADKVVSSLVKVDWLLIESLF